MARSSIVRFMSVKLEEFKLKKLLITCSFLFSLSSFADCPLIIKFSPINHDNGLDGKQTKILNKKLMNVLEQKGYAPEIMERLEDGDFDASIVVSYGVEPYFPLVTSCAADIRIRYTKRVGWGSTRVHGDEVSKQGIFMNKRKCMKAITQMINNIPSCTEL